ncbi:MAG: glycosyltransferase family 2 protein [Planctomycetes bacterium]|nr:glycosyltransferase family 2 protein [Planctomycetota bacterium]
MISASLCMPTWNAGPLLDEVLDAVDRQPGAERLERLAIDSGSTDGTVDCLRRHGFAVESIPQREFDHGRTRDALVERARGDVVVLLTQDATPADDRWLPALLACYADPLVGAAYCRQLPRPDCNPFIARRLLEWTAGRDAPVVQQCESAEAFARLEPMQRLRTCAYDNVAGSVRRSAWEQHRFGSRPFGEDVAFGKRLILGGWRIVYEPRSAVVHSHNRSPRDEGKRIYCDHQNLRDLFDVHLLPTWESYRDAVAWGQREYVRIVDELQLDDDDARALRNWARRYAHWGALGMFLGARSAELTSGAFAARFRALDRLLHRAI